MGKESQCVKFLTAKYKVRRNQLSSSPRSNASWCWRSLEKAKAILLKGACWSIGDGRSVLVWEDPWVPECLNFRPLPLSEESLGRSLVVSYFFNQEGTDWDIHKLQAEFNQSSVKAIKAIPVCSKANQDQWIWTKSCLGTTLLSLLIRLLLVKTNHLT